jgi:hypothetical protein
VHLEGAAMFEEITAPDMMGDDPVYHITWGDSPFQVKGARGCSTSTPRSATSCCGTRATRSPSPTGASPTRCGSTRCRPAPSSRRSGQKVEKDDGLYLVSSRQAFIWPYNDRALLTGEHLYEDKSTLTIEEIDPAQAMTPERGARNPQGVPREMEAEDGPAYWVYRG